MEKLIKVPSRVRDLYGLYADLRKSAFNVLNVAADSNGTYVYLDMNEEKDPTPFIESWANKPMPTQSLAQYLKRVNEAKELAKIIPPKEEEAPKPSMLTKIFRRIF